jgi:hypothetical protein
MNSAFRRYFDLTGVRETGSVSARRVALQVRANGSNTPWGRLIFAVFSTLNGVFNRRQGSFVRFNLFLDAVGVSQDFSRFFLGGLNNGLGLPFRRLDARFRIAPDRVEQ